MKRVLSILLCLTMLLSGFCLAEEAAPAKAATAVISDITLTLEGTEYALNPQIAAGALAGDNSLLLDFSILSEGDALLPVQAKLDEGGVALMLGSSRTAYAIPMELLAEELYLDELPMEALGAYIEAYGRLMEMAMDLQKNPVQLTPAETDALLAKVGVDIAAENVTATINGVKQPASHRTYTVDHGQMLQLVDEMMNTIAPGYMAAYSDLMNAAFALTGEESPLGDAVTYSALFAEVPMEMTMTVDETVNAAGSGFGTIDLTMSVTADTYGEPETVSLRLPMEYTAIDADTVSITASTVIDADGSELAMDFVSAVDGQFSNTSLTMLVDQSVSINITAENLPGFDGSSAMNTAFDVAIDGEDTASAAIGYTAFADGTASCDFRVSAMQSLYGFSCHADIGGYALEDRISAAETMAFSELSETDPAFMRLMLAAAGLAGDAEILLNEASVAPLVNAITEMIEMYSYDEYDPYVEEYYDDYDLYLEETYDEYDLYAEDNFVEYEPKIKVDTVYDPFAPENLEGYAVESYEEYAEEETYAEEEYVRHSLKDSLSADLFAEETAETPAAVEDVPAEEAPERDTPQSIRSQKNSLSGNVFASMTPDAAASASGATSAGLSERETPKSIRNR